MRPEPGEGRRLLAAAELLSRSGADPGLRPNVGSQLEAIGEIRRLLPLFEERAVREARADRITWATIAFSMGLSHQAVIKRWRKRLHGDGYDPMSSRIRPDRLPARGPAPPRIPLWNVPRVS